MARLLRSTTTSKLRKPTVLGPSTVFGPVKTTLAPSPRQAREAHPVLRPPNLAVAAAAPPPFAPIKVRLADPPTDQRFRQTRYGLAQPVVVFVPAEPPEPPIEVRLAPSTRLARQPKTSKLSPPGILLPPAEPLPRPLLVKLAVARRPRPTSYGLLRRPEVLGDVVVPVVLALAPVSPGVLALAPAGPGTLPLSTAAPGALVLIPVGEGTYGAALYGAAVYGVASPTTEALTLVPFSPGVLTLNPRL